MLSWCLVIVVGYKKSDVRRSEGYRKQENVRGDQGDNLDDEWLWRSEWKTTNGVQIAGGWMLGSRWRLDSTKEAREDSTMACQRASARERVVSWDPQVRAREVRSGM